MSAPSGKWGTEPGPVWAVADGQPLLLGAEVGRGGEGVVYGLTGQAERVVKLYHTVPPARKAAKLAALVASSTPAVRQVVAWPLDLARNAAGQVVGVVLPRVVGRRDIHQLYSPKSRAMTFPEADFRFITHVAANVARAFAVLHAAGHVVGDVNHGSIVVSSDGTVRLIDADSFQVQHGGETYTCDVGQPLFSAPELLGQGFRGVVRTPNHDAFGLAVVLFHLLCVGRHPFAGRYLGPGEMPIERAMAEFRFAYGDGAASRQMAPPPGTVPLAALGAEVAGLFEAAFGAGGARGERPDAAAWVAALDRLGAALVACDQVPNHHYPPVAAGGACPWCALEAQTGLRLFGQRLQATAGDVVDVGQLWAAIEAVPEEPPAPPLPGARAVPPVVPPLPRRWVWEWRARWAAAMLLIIAVAGAMGWLGSLVGLKSLVFGLGFSFALLSRILPTSWFQLFDHEAYAAARANWEAALALWQKPDVQGGAWAARRQALEQTRKKLTDLPAERQRRLHQLEQARGARQLARYLDHFRLEAATISGIGASRKAMLLSFGIETAADVVPARIKRIPGFGPVLTAELLAWRQGLEQRFHPNPHEPLDPRDVAAMDQALAALRRQLADALRQGPAELTRLNEQVRAARARVQPLLDQAWVAWQVAEQQKTAR